MNHYRTLIHLRNEQEALRVGDWIEVETDSADVSAFLRTVEDQELLVLINFSGAPVSDYALSLTEGLLAADSEPQTLFGSAELQPLNANELGGFDNYKPIDTLPPQSSFIIQL